MTIEDIRKDIDFLCGSTSATYYTSHKHRNITNAYRDVCTLIWQSDGGWHYDDSNNTDSPVAYKTLANASASYVVPTTALRIKQVEVKDSGSVWQKLKPITLDEIPNSPEQFITGGGMPIYYMLEGNEIRLFPAPATNSVTMASGMVVRLSRDVTPLGASAVSTTPGFPAPFHKILSYSAALDFVQDNVQRQFFLAQKDRLEKGLIKFFSKRADELPAVIKPDLMRRWRTFT